MSNVVGKQQNIMKKEIFKKIKKVLDNKKTT